MSIESRNRVQCHRYFDINKVSVLHRRWRPRMPSSNAEANGAGEIRQVHCTSSLELDDLKDVINILQLLAQFKVKKVLKTNNEGDWDGVVAT